MSSDPSGFDTPARSVGNIINRRTATASRLLARAERLATLSDRLQALDTTWSRHVRLGNLRAGTAIVYVDNASAAARARLDVQRIADCLHSNGVSCTAVMIKVRPVGQWR